MNGSPDTDALLDLAQEKVAVLDDRGTFEYVNEASVDVLGYDPEELVGTDALDYVHPEDADRVRDDWADLLAGDRDVLHGLTYRCRTADGDWVWLETDGYAPSETGLDGYAISSRDVTEEVESRRRLEGIAAKSPDVLWMFSADWSELLFVNDAVEDVFGVDVAALEAEPLAFLDAVHPDDRSYVEQAMERLSAGEPTDLDYRVNPDEDYSRWVRVPGEPIYEDGQVVRVAGVAREVTEEYQRNRQLAVMDNLLRHNIRNDMNVVTGMASLIAEHADGETVSRAETIEGVGRELIETVEKQRGVIDLLNQQASPRAFDVAELVDGVVADARETLDEGTIAVDTPETVRAFTLPEIGYALSELVDNAIEHADSTPAVRVAVAEVDGSVRIAVEDNCPPIPDEEQLVVTDQHEMTDLYHTVGMGLWLVYWAVDRSGGRLSFDTHPDGNRVVVTLPSAATEDDGAPLPDE